MSNHLIETWQIHNKINLYLLNAIDEEHLSSAALSKGKTVAEHFAHIHNVRLMWLKVAEPRLLSSLEKIEKDNIITKIMLLDQLQKSENAVSLMLENAIDIGKLKGFKPHPTAFIGYLISHESHHRGQIVISLKQAGYALDKKILFGLWEWGTK